MSSNKSNHDAKTYDAQSISTSSILSEKEEAQRGFQSRTASQKTSLTSRLIQKIKSIEPPEPRIPNRNRSSMPGWAR
ncbi:hypothetical protein DV736_g2800, partial [Chaetothyriales sp. CBS 134916]